MMAAGRSEHAVARKSGNASTVPVFREDRRFEAPGQDPRRSAQSDGSRRALWEWVGFETHSGKARNSSTAGCDPGPPFRFPQEHEPAPSNPVVNFLPPMVGRSKGGRLTSAIAMGLLGEEYRHRIAAPFQCLPHARPGTVTTWVNDQA
jgi:hypothetical protein